MHMHEYMHACTHSCEHTHTHTHTHTHLTESSLLCQEYSSENEEGGNEWIFWIENKLKFLFWSLSYTTFLDPFWN